MRSAATTQPTLENGDRLSLDEFMWRWEQLPDLKQAELIEGVVYLASPLSRAHGLYDDLFHRWLIYYADLAGGLSISPNTTCVLGNNAYQPDLVLIRDRPGKDTKYIETVPELIVEIVDSSRAHDLGPKLAAYRSAGVAEYIAVLIGAKRVEWRVLSGTRYRLLDPGADGILKSPGFPGLWLDTGAVFPPGIKRIKAALGH